MKLISLNVLSGLLAVVLSLISIGHAQTTPATSNVKTIFDYKNELNLTDRQEQDIKTFLQDLNKEVVVTRAKLTLIEVEVGDLIKNDGDLEQIKRKLKDATDLQVSLKLADIVATRKINKTLSAEQLKKWREIQTAAAKPQK